jgi:hypothetical protein
MHHASKVALARKHLIHCTEGGGRCRQVSIHKETPEAGVLLVVLLTQRLAE